MDTNTTDMDVTGLFSTSMTGNMTTMTTMTTTTTLSPEPDMTTMADDNAPLFILKQISGDIPEFEIILPCIFGVFIILSLGLMVFYTKNPTDTKTKALELDGRHDNHVHADGKMDSSWF